MENQTDKVASMDNNSGNSDNSALRKDDLGRHTKSNNLKHAIKRIRHSSALRFILLIEDFPKHRVVEKISPLHAVVVFYLCLFTGLLGFFVFAYTTFLGFIAYYVTVGVAVLEILHYMYDK
ncbi:MAG: hypothetical protein QHH18_02930 [Candidatus Bathyarchaeota archaeon]|nr:hypothetical protein [Candidatus Bathyarchaeota archaeon A05DMB-5]MDH7557547.1 hypothetical protein [Candidatus Bathyarchaeota archaeon]